MITLLPVVDMHTEIESRCLDADGVGMVIRMIESDMDCVIYIYIYLHERRLSM